MADNNIYLVKQFSALEECERKYDFMPAAETSPSKGYDHYCLAQTLNLAKARQKNTHNIKRLEKILSDARSVAVKFDYK